MKLALRIVVLLVALVVLAVVIAAAVIYSRAERPPRPVGFTRIVVPDPQDRPLEVGVWYPTDAEPGFQLIGLSAQRVAANAPVTGRDLPLVVISHGNPGLMSSHADTALALASAGIVAAAVTHTGDNPRDQAYVGTPRWLVDRARHVHLAIDYLLTQWPAHGQLDPARVGVFGFSAGGFTALVAAGGTPDIARMLSHCQSEPEFACKLWRDPPPPSTPASAWVHDARIKAAVVAAPGYGFAFGPEGLQGVKAAVQLWGGADDQNVPVKTNGAAVRALLPNGADEHVVPGAGHFAFLAPCPGWLFPAICRDAGGFDRVAFHRDFNRGVVAFFQAHLGARP